VADDIRAAGGQAISLVADVSSPAAGRRHGQSDGRCVRQRARFGEQTPRCSVRSRSNRSWKSNRRSGTGHGGQHARAYSNASKRSCPRCARKKYGKIVNIASGTLFKGTPPLVALRGFKRAVVAMTRVMARELGGDNILVNCIAPGLTLSPRSRPPIRAKKSRQNKATRALKREEEPEDLVGALIFFLSAESDFITGQTLLVDGGSVMH